MADELAWSVGADTETIIDPHDLAATIRHAFLDELASGKSLDEATGDTGPTTFYGMTTPVAKMLDWLIGHHPRTAHHTIGEIIGKRRTPPGHPSPRHGRNDPHSTRTGQPAPPPDTAGLPRPGPATHPAPLISVAPITPARRRGRPA
ncbi:hypothetical protein [Streptomyces sp. PSKA30]|uniref:hypothetical protein n=1 Tax=Streptomyces sp. PSKA30 TaxID=2874597 RepID=UPI001CD1926A|nr:hypothetical protein [Streptomyces sp. PSKA30]MBZ9645759.1 hypothetical protein [Streptomyces sp. PSKA30]